MFCIHMMNSVGARTHIDTNRQTHRQTDRQTDRHTHTHTHTCLLYTSDAADE